MAESLRSKFEKHLTCSVCLGQLKDPKVLPCLHSYCHVCIVNLAKNSRTNTINCPECRLAIKVDGNTISSLATNFFVNNLLATMALTNDKPVGAKKIVCDNCDNEDAAQSRCNECGMFLCQFCTESHKRYRSTKLHKLLTMKELKSSAGPQNIAEKIKCPKHKEEVIKLFCKTCQATICRDCTIVDHQGHTYGFVEEVAVKEKQHLQRNLNDVKHRKARVVQGIANLRKFYQLVEAKKKSTISEIDRHFDELAKAVESRKKQMVEKASSLTNSKQKQIYAQLEALEVALATCESSIEFTEQAFKNGNDVQILSMEKYILQSLEQLKTVKDQTEPCVTEDMMFMIPSSVKETEKKLLNEYDVTIQVASPGNCIASFGEAEKPRGEIQSSLASKCNKAEASEAGKQCSITLICNDKYSRGLKYGGQVIKTSFTGMEVSDIAVTDNKDGSNIITFCRRQGGMLKFNVSIDGMPAPNCSLTKQVKWVIANVYGKGVITNDGKTMRGDGGAYSCRVGGCYFESGVHTWKVQVTSQNYFSGYDNAEVGIIDCNEIHANIAKSKTKWVYRYDARRVNSVTITTSLTLDMDKKTLKVTTTNLGHPSYGYGYNNTGTTQNYQFTARRVSPFFACSSPSVTLSLVE